jgi:hypothetical protein
MKALTLKPSEVRIRGLRALKRDLGAAGMAQFIQQFSGGRGDYSRERHKVLDRLTLDEVWAAVKPQGHKR